MIVGYARTSSLAQVVGLEAQERELRAAECDKIFREQVSSVAERKQLEAALDYVREGDSFTVTKLDRLARSVGDLLGILGRLEAKKVSLRVLSMSGTQALDTAASTGRLMLSVIGAVGQPSARRCRMRVSPRPSEKATTRAVCRPFAGRLTRSVEGPGR
jgi:DNA invertase Pin-like site-specific DNA recombinase